MKRTDTYVLDTSAVLTLFEGEPGVNVVKGILRRARRKKCRACVSLMTTYEILYVTTQEQGEEEGLRRILELRNLPLVELPLSPDIALRAAHLKARYRISVADSWIAATAASESATLVHKDPELQQLANELRLEALPFK